MRHVESMLHWDSVPGRVLVMCVNHVLRCADQLPCSKSLLSRPLMACTACHVVLNKLRSAHDVESASVWQSLAAREAFVAVYAFPGHHKEAGNHAHCAAGDVVHSAA